MFCEFQCIGIVNLRLYCGLCDNRIIRALAGALPQSSPRYGVRGATDQELGSALCTAVERTGSREGPAAARPAWSVEGTFQGRDRWGQLLPIQSARYLVRVRS